MPSAAATRMCRQCAACAPSCEGHGMGTPFNVRRLCDGDMPQGTIREMDREEQAPGPPPQGQGQHAKKGKRVERNYVAESGRIRE